SPRFNPGAARGGGAGARPDYPASGTAEPQPSTADATDDDTRGADPVGTETSAAGGTAGPPAAEPAIAIELSLDKIARAWSIILNQVKKRRIPLHAVLQEGRPLELEGNLLTIGFPAGS